VQFKEFGIRLNFTPVVNGNRVHLKVRPEVSTLDFNNAVVLQGFRIPALSTRRTETELELNDGQTFAIAGLINNTMNSSLQKIPGIGDIPILGLLFKSKAAQKDQTELVVMITPEILPNNSPGVTPNLPRLPEPFLPNLPEKKTVPPPPPAFSEAPASGTSTTTTPGAKALPASPKPQAANVAPSRTAAATAVSALTPAAPRVIQLADVASTLPSTPVAMNEKDKKALEKTRREEDQRAKEQAKTDARLKAEEAKRQSAQAEADQKKAAADQERQEKLAREQAKRDADAARRAEEENQKQLERQREQQKTVDEAQAKLKAAQAAYDAEVAKSKQ
jgi:hypothetical protein